MNEKKNATANEPLIHLSKRESISIVKSWLIRLAAIVLGLVVCGLVAYILSDKLRSGKKTIFDFYHSFLVKGSFSTSRKMWKFFKNMAVLQCISLAVTPAFRMQFWNTGAEGQTLMGVWGAIAVAFYLGGRVPAALLLVLMLAAALLCGALELTGGVAALGTCALPVSLKLASASFLLAFSGLSICAQTAAVLSEDRLFPRGYLFARLLQGLIAAALTMALAALLRVDTSAVQASAQPVSHMMPVLLSLIWLSCGIICLICRKVSYGKKAHHRV